MVTSGQSEVSGAGDSDHTEPIALWVVLAVAVNSSMPLHWLGWSEHLPLPLFVELGGNHCRSGGHSDNPVCFAVRLWIGSEPSGAGVGCCEGVMVSGRPGLGTLSPSRDSAWFGASAHRDLEVV